MQWLRVGTLIVGTALLAACSERTTTGALPEWTPQPGDRVYLDAVVASWPDRYVLVGSKGVGTWVEYVEVHRDGERFALIGGAPRGEVQQVTELEAVNGSLRSVPCLMASASCDVEPTVGFLSTAAVVAAAQRGSLEVSVELQNYADRLVVCPPASILGVNVAALDPCFDVLSGAVIAQRHPVTGDFDGPSLDPWSVSITVPDDTTPQDNIIPRGDLP